MAHTRDDGVKVKDAHQTSANSIPVAANDISVQRRVVENPHVLLHTPALIAEALSISLRTCGDHQSILQQAWDSARIVLIIASKGVVYNLLYNVLGSGLSYELGLDSSSTESMLLRQLLIGTNVSVSSDSGTGTADNTATDTVYKHVEQVTFHECDASRSYISIQE
uniref:Uncharacterized protein n=1 Tax=Lygus hesperus TaxID=30085 RepID=A0A146M0S9_LYGHE